MSYRSTEWQDKAECRNDRFFDNWPIAERLEVCKGCAVKKQCTELGLSTIATVKDALDSVVFGGLRPTEFAELVRKRGPLPHSHFGGKP